MEFFSLPDPPVSSLTQRINLDGVEYLMRLRWNPRYGWFIALDDPSTEESILGWRRMSVNWPLLIHCTHERRPPGSLMLLDRTNTYVDAGYNDLDNRCLLSYTPVDEL